MEFDSSLALIPLGKRKDLPLPRFSFLFFLYAFTVVLDPSHFFSFLLQSYRRLGFVSAYVL